MTKYKYKLNKNNYYSANNKYITNSKLGDYLKDKRYFYEKHVLGKVETEPSDAMLIGKAVDCYLMEGSEEFKKKYVPVLRRNLKDPPKDYTEINATMYEDIVKMSERIMSQTAFKELKGYKKQQILQVDMPLGDIFYGIAGTPDWLKMSKDANHCVIVDLKTTQSIDPNKYYWHCLSYGYFRQQAMYQMLVEKVHGITNFKSYHLVMEKDTDKIYNCQVFELDQNKINEEKVFINTLLAEIAQEKLYLPGDTSFVKAYPLGGVEVETV